MTAKYSMSMLNRSSNQKDEIRSAYNIIQGYVENEKNPAAVALGRLGGLKGGRARAEKLSAIKRSEIARKAAVERWRK